MQLSSKEISLVACFAALYVAVSFIPASPFPLIGGEGYIDASTVISLVIGAVLGPLLGGLAVIIGGIIVPFIIPSLTLGAYTFIPHAMAAVCAGALKKGKQTVCVLIYLLSFIFFAFFPSIGPFWTWPLMLWFHLIALALMVSPAQTWAAKKINSEKSSSMSVGIAITFLTSTVCSQAVGSIIFEFLKIGSGNPDYWRTVVWQPLTFIYPIERLIITAIATVIAAPILKALKTQRFKI